MVTVKQFFDHFLKENSLGDFYPGIQLRHLLDTYFLLFPKENELSEYTPKIEFCENLKRGYPLEYLCQKSYFYRSEFYVDERVLIPRSESEILVEMALEELSKIKSNEIRVAEIGVGSFCLGLSFLIDANKKIDFVGGDLSRDALEVARINTEKLKDVFKFNHSINLFESDRMQNMNDSFHLIFSNPPYIREEADKKGVHIQVDTYEPHLALYLKDKEYMSWFDQFFKEVSLKLEKSGVFIMEGHEDTLEALKDLGKNYFSTVDIRQDYNQANRFFIGRKL